MESENLKMRVTARELESKTIDTLKLREDYAKKEILRQFGESIEYGQLYFVRLEKNVTDGHFEKMLDMNLQYVEVGNSEHAQAIRFYEAFKKMLYRHSPEYEKKIMGVSRGGTEGNSIVLNINLRKGEDLDKLMEILAEIWEKEHNE